MTARVLPPYECASSCLNNYHSSSSRLKYSFIDIKVSETTIDAHLRPTCSIRWVFRKFYSDYVFFLSLPKSSASCCRYNYWCFANKPIARAFERFIVLLIVVYKVNSTINQRSAKRFTIIPTFH